MPAPITFTEITFVTSAWLFVFPTRTCVERFPHEVIRGGLGFVSLRSARTIRLSSGTLPANFPAASSATLSFCTPFTLIAAVAPAGGAGETPPPTDTESVVTVLLFPGAVSPSTKCGGIVVVVLEVVVVRVLLVVVVELVVDLVLVVEMLVLVVVLELVEVVGAHIPL